ncbi:MAG: hypothetical protein H7Z10_01980, partial [Gemmatimonadaceae bacterium]|nr:hypothetical protein [Acetobacteraceae bacterium]
GPRLPEPALHAATQLPLVAVDPELCSAAARVVMALDCATGTTGQVAGAFA